MSTPTTPTAAAPSIGTQAETILKEFVETLGLDGLTILKGTLGNTLVKLDGAPTAINLVAQGTALIPSLIADEPLAESTGIKAGVSALQKLLALLPSAPPASA